MNPKHVVSKSLGEEYYYLKHPSGLGIYIHPKKGYSSNYAILGTNFGSINNKFRLKNETSFTEVPDGIAHYLEHKIFETPQGDAFSLFAKTGASANAYTSFEKTAFLFSCTGNFEKSLDILLEFVSSPYFTPENVEKERGIIGQEIKMYEDSPDWKVFINLLGAMYKNHPVNRDIAGSVESISKITPELLYKCYNSFYNLHNMTLCMVGDMDPDKIFTIVDKKLGYSMPVKVERYFPDEPHEVAKTYVSQNFDIQSSVFNLGFKENVLPMQRATNEELVYTDIMLSYFSSPSSEMYNKLLKDGLINTATFSSEYLEGPGYASIIFSGESKNPEKTSELIRDYMRKAHENGLDKEAFERAKKAVYGRSLSVFNSIQSIANLTLEFDFSGKEIFEYMDILQDATVEKANKRLEKELLSDYSSLSVVKPYEK
ncbi:MAG: pitrilysin family protein [Clostridia bacterium]|nr:pitrilysin family protein [Clostridia bacterium]